MAEYMLVGRKLKIYKRRREHFDAEYKTLYRFSKKNIEWMKNYFLGEIEETRGGCLTNLQKMCVYLRFLADPGFPNSIADNSGIHQSTVSRTVSEMAYTISEKANEWIRFPSTPDDIKNAQEMWVIKYKFPFAIVAIDCTHFKIKKPVSHCDEYVCRKGYHSMNVQATCDANEQFTSVDISWPGSVHDSRILRNSRIYNTMNSLTTDAVILGDEGYGLSTWLMTPFRNPVSSAEKNYNGILTKERCVIERCFGQLKQRFSALQYKLRVATELVPRVIASGFVLHNIAKYLDDEIVFDNDINITFPENTTNTQPFQQMSSVAGKTKRQAIANMMVNI